MPTPTEPITYQALEGVAEALAKISTPDYYTDVARVSLELFQAGSRDTFPVIFVAGEEMPEGYVDCVVECYIAQKDAEAQKKAHRIIADVVAALPKGRDVSVNRNGFVSAAVTGRGIAAPTHGLPYVVAQVNLRLQIAEN